MMHEADPELVVAFVTKPLAQSRGTADMCRVAEGFGVTPIVIVVADLGGLRDERGLRLRTGRRRW